MKRHTATYTITATVRQGYSFDHDDRREADRLIAAHRDWIRASTQKGLPGWNVHVTVTDHAIQEVDGCD